jgi:hypothetical protein
MEAKLVSCLKTDRGCLRVNYDFQRAIAWRFLAEERQHFCPELTLALTTTRRSSWCAL